MGYWQGGEERKALQVVFGNRVGDKDGFRTLWKVEHKRFKSFAQHCGVFLSVVAEPSFPKREGPYAVVWHGGFAISDDVFDVLTRTQLHTTSKELLRSNRGDTCFLVIAGLPRNALADDKLPDVHFAIR